MMKVEKKVGEEKARLRNGQKRRESDVLRELTIYVKLSAKR